jgi:tetratricopeptide (TPR) repeat protein
MHFDLSDEQRTAFSRALAHVAAGLPEFSPVRNGPCLCGSGLKYKRCCAGRLPVTQPGARTRSLLNEEKYEEALHACRADITQYTIWHKSHTELSLPLEIPKLGSLLEIDVRALAELVDTLLWCYIKANLIDEFPAVLERLRYNIKDTRWQRKIVYFHAVHALWPDWEDEQAGRRELKKLGSIADDTDIETLQLYLDLFRADLTFSETNELIDRILSLSETLTDRLHYKGSKAVLYFTIGDHRRANAEVSEIIAEVRSKYDESKLSEFQRYRLALTLSFAGVLRQDDKLLTQAFNLYQQLLKEDHWSSYGRADLLGRIGEMYRHKGEWTEARKFYAQALEAHQSEIYKVFLSECLLQLDQLEEAAEVLSEVKSEDLSSAEYLDYGFALAALAIEKCEHGRIEDAKAALKRATVREPYFRERRDAVLLNLQEALTIGVSQTLIRRTRRLVADMARSAASYLILRPSFMGIGLDVGKIVEDLSKRGETQNATPGQRPRAPGRKVQSPSSKQP